MKKIIGLIGILSVGATTALANVTLDFSYDTGTYPTRLDGYESSLSFLFSIDGSGNVSLNASTLNADPDGIAIVNSWDGPAGTVTDSLLWGTTFALQATGYSVTNGFRDIQFEPDQAGGIAIQGNNSGRIDGVGPGRDPEYLEFTLTSGSVTLNFDTVMYVGGASGSDFCVADGTISNAFYNVGTDGTKSISGRSLASGGVLSIAQPADTDQYDNGIALGGLTFTVSAVGGTVTNLIQNGSFETGTAGWTVGAPSEVAASSDTVADGMYSLKLTGSEGAVAATGQIIPVQSNTDYVFTHAIYYPTGSTGTVTASLVFDARTLKISTGDSTDGWVSKETRFNSGGATEIALDVYAGNAFNGPVYVDDFRLEKLLEPFRYDIWDDGFVDVDLSEQRGDYDEDGAVNLIEYALDGNPTNPADLGVAPSLGVQGDTLKYMYRLRNDDLNLASSTEVCTNLPSAIWTGVDFETMTTGTVGQFDDVVQDIPFDMPQAFFRLKVETRSSNFINDGYYEIVPTGTANDSAMIQAALDQVENGDTLRLTGDFFIRDTIYLPSNFKWVLDGTLTLADGADDYLDEAGWYQELNDANNNIIDATRRTGISEQPGGAENIEMSGGTYSGNFANNSSSLRFINFVSVTDSYFHDMVITDVSDDNFTLGPGCNNNECRNLTGSFAGGNALTDKGDHNKWYDCIAEDCASDGWTPKCRYSEFYRCIARRNDGPGFGMYCRIDGSGKPDDLGEAIDGNKFFDCVSWGNNAAGFSFNISSTSGEGGTIISNYVEAVCYSNASSGVRFRNKMPNSIVADNEINLLCYDNRGEKKDGSLNSLAGGLGTDASSSNRVTAITGAMVSFDNVQWDVNTGKAYDSNIRVYHPAGETAPVLKQGDSSNIITLEVFDCAVDPLVEWCMQEYCDLFNNP